MSIHVAGGREPFTPPAQGPQDGSQDSCQRGASVEGRFKMTDGTQKLWLAGAVIATFFTNLEPIPMCVILAPLCNLVLVESVDKVSRFVWMQVPIGLALGASAFGYLLAASFIIAVALQAPLSIAFLAHRALRRRHPDSAAVTLAFPCVLTAAYVLAMNFLPIGSTGNPAYSATGLQLLMQWSALFGRNCIVFLLLWTAAVGAGFAVDRRPAGGTARNAARLCLVVWVVVLLAGGLRLHWPRMFRGIEDWDGVVNTTESHQVSCLTSRDSIFEQTRIRLAAGDSIVIHSERATGRPSGNSSDLIARYASLLEDSFSSSGIEALLVLSFLDWDAPSESWKSWYHLLTRSGSEMSYPKNNPVPLVEGDITAGQAPPSVIGARIGKPSSAISVSGTICFDTDFPSLTRALSGAALLLETSDTWYNIGEAHFQGHLLTAVENGATLVKCTSNGVTGAFDPRGNVLFQVPQSEGTVSFTLPLFRGAVAFPRAGTAFDVVITISAFIWLVLAASPRLSLKCGLASI